MRFFRCLDRFALCGRRGVAAAFCVTLSTGVASAQLELSPAAVLRHWDVNGGLPNARVFAIAHTPDGYVWMGTYGGLARFDGIAFTTFTPDDTPAIGSEGIMSLAVDERGTLWIGTEEGHLVAHDADGFRRVPVPAAAGRQINVIQPGSDGRVWLGTQVGAIAIDSRTARSEAMKDGLETVNVSNLVVDGGGQAWALAGGIVHRLDNGRWQAHRLDDAVSSKVTAIAAAAGGGVWCADNASRLSSGRGTQLYRIGADGGVDPVSAGPWPRTPTRSRIEALLEDATGRLWCATRGSGVYCRNPDGTWDEPSKGTSLSRVDGIGLSTDAIGAVWIGTRNSGAYQASPIRVEARRLPETVGDHVVTSVCARADGTLWVGTDGSGVVSWQGRDARRFGVDDGLPALDVGAVAEACGGRLYAGTPRGVARLDDDRFVPAATPEAAVACLFADRDDRLWVGTAAGVVRIDADDVRPMPRDDGAPLDAVGFAQDGSGRIIALGRSGSLHELLDDGFHPMLDAPDLSPRARAIAADADGGLWLGNYGAGITHVNGDATRRWSMQQNGLPSSHVLAIVPLADVMWVCSENGVFGCPVAEFTQAPRGRHPLPTWRVTEAEGLPEKVCTAGGQPVACIGPDRRIWVPNGRFVAGFLPTEIMEPMPVFPPLVERIVADGRERMPLGRGLHQLPVGTGQVEFHFTSPNTVAPQRLQFRHRLVGFDERWMAVDNRRVASYSGLPPGDYTFRLEVSDPMGSWRSPREDVGLRIPPRFWQRRDVQAAVACGLAGSLAAAGWGWERRRTRARLARLELERAREQERQRIARDIHDDLGSGLTEIVMLSDLASREVEASPGAATVRHIADRARTLTRAMDEVVWAINPRNDSLEGFITYFHRWAQAYLGNAGLRVRWELPIETTEAPLSAEVRHHLFLACKEAVANIVKHAEATEVRIACRVLTDGLEIDIVDDGRGFPLHEPAGDGDGLANLRARLAAVGGECDIRSQPQQGTTVRFHVPVDRSTFHGQQG